MAGQTQLQLPPSERRNDKGVKRYGSAFGVTVLLFPLLGLRMSVRRNVSQPSIFDQQSQFREALCWNSYFKVTGQKQLELLHPLSLAENRFLKVRKKTSCLLWLTQRESLFQYMLMREVQLTNLYKCTTKGDGKRRRKTTNYAELFMLHKHWAGLEEDVCREIGSLLKQRLRYRVYENTSKTIHSRRAWLKSVHIDFSITSSNFKRINSVADST